MIADRSVGKLTSGVLVAGEDPAALELLRSVLSPAMSSDVGSLATPMSALPGALAGARRLQLLVVHFAGNVAEGIQALEQVHGRAAVPTIVICDELDGEAVRALLRLKVSDWLPTTVEPQALVTACERARAAVQPVARTGTELNSIALCSASGGAGSTLIACELANLVAERFGFENTCLIDLNFDGGMLADYLDVPAKLDIAPLVSAPERLDRQLLEVMLTRTTKGLAVLAPIRGSAEASLAGRHLTEALLSTASEMFEHLVIDLPTGRPDVARPVLSGADRIYVVADSTVPAVRRARELIASTRDVCRSDAVVGCLVNKWPTGWFGKLLSEGDVTEVVGSSLTGFLPEQRALCASAINQGKPLGEISRSNGVTKQLKRLVLPSGKLG